MLAYFRSIARSSRSAVVRPGASPQVNRLLTDMTRGGFYAVARGRRTGVFTKWSECEAQVKGFPGALYKKLPTLEAAQSFAHGEYEFALATTPAKRTVGAQPVSTEVPRKQRRIDDNSRDLSVDGGPIGSRVTVYCDGAATGNGKAGASAGWGVWFADEGPLSQLNESRRLPGTVQTNNRGELMAIIRAVQLAPPDCELTIHTDSQYSLQAIGTWQHGWRAKKWTRPNGEKVQNKDLIRRLERELRARKTRPTLRYVKGHAGIYGNEMADRLATQGASLPDVPISEWQDLEPSDSETEAEITKSQRSGAQIQVKNGLSSVESSQISRHSSQSTENAENDGLDINLSIEDEELATPSPNLASVLSENPKILARLVKAGFDTISDVADEVSLQGHLLDDNGRPTNGVRALAKELRVSPEELIDAVNKVRNSQVSPCTTARPMMAASKMARALAPVSGTPESFASTSAASISAPATPKYSLSHFSQKLGGSLVSESIPPSLASPKDFKPMRPAPSPSSLVPAASTQRQSEEPTWSVTKKTPTLVQAKHVDAPQLSTQLRATTPLQAEEAEHTISLAIPPPRVLPAPLVSTGLPSLDDFVTGSADGAAFELIGPTASGKTLLGLQMLARCRVDAVLKGKRSELSAEAEATEEAPEDFDQCVIVDTEGSCNDEDVERSVVDAIAQLAGERSLDLSTEEQESISSEALNGIYRIRATTDAELMSLLHLLTSPVEAPEASSPAAWPLPPVRLLSAIFLDSLSYHVRDPVDTQAQRSTRRFMLSMLSSLQGRLHALNPRTRLIATNEMTLKMYTPQGDLVNYRTAGSIARLVPQIDAAPGGLDGSGRAWNGVEDVSGTASPTPFGQASNSQLSHDGSSQRQQRQQQQQQQRGVEADGKGCGILGEAAQRLLLFRDGQSRYVQMIYSAGIRRGAAQPWIPFEMKGSNGRLVQLDDGSA